MVRVLSALLSCAILAGGVFFAREYYESKVLLLDTTPSLALDLSSEMLNYLLVAVTASIFFFALLIYVLLTTRVAARRLAFTITKDIYFSQEQFRKFYDYSPVPYLLISLNGEIVRPNMAAVRMLGLTQEQLLGKDVFTYFQTTGDASRIDNVRTRVARHVPIEKQEMHVIPLNGIPRWVLLSVEYLKDPGGTYRGLVTIVDIHEQKELERVKTEFMSLASHQLRAPLANLKWYIDFLISRRGATLTDEVKEYLQKMYRRNEDMIDLVNSLLNLSRIEMGRMTVQKEDTDVSQLARSVLEELEPLAREKHITLTGELGTSVHTETDPRLLRIIIQNITSNGIRYTPDSGSVIVRVQTLPKKISISVEDTGIGIPPEEQAHIFEKMYRASNAKSMEANGNGIGLYMCKALTESLGGTIVFTTIQGQGTTFTVELFT